MSRTDGVPPGHKPPPPATNETPPGKQPLQGQPATKPKLQELDKDRTSKRSLQSRKIKPNAMPSSTDGLKKATPEELMTKRNEVLQAINNLTVKSGNMKLLYEASQAVEDPSRAPKHIAIKVLINDKWVSFVPPDEEALKDEDMDALRKEVKEAIASAYAECARIGSGEQVNAVYTGLQNEFIEISKKLGQEASKEETIQGLLRQAVTFTPKMLRVDYSGGAVMIERIQAPRKEPKAEDQPPNQPPDQSQGQPPNSSQE